MAADLVKGRHDFGKVVLFFQQQRMMQNQYAAVGVIGHCQRTGGSVTAATVCGVQRAEPGIDGNPLRPHRQHEIFARESGERLAVILQSQFVVPRLRRFVRFRIVKDRQSGFTGEQIAQLDNVSIPLHIPLVEFLETMNDVGQDRFREIVMDAKILDTSDWE